MFIYIMYKDRSKEDFHIPTPVFTLSARVYIERLESTMYRSINRIMKSRKIHEFNFKTFSIHTLNSVPGVIAYFTTYLTTQVLNISHTFHISLSFS